MAVYVHVVNGFPNKTVASVTQCDKYMCFFFNDGTCHVIGADCDPDFQYSFESITGTLDDYTMAGLGIITAEEHTARQEKKRLNDEKRAEQYRHEQYLKLKKEFEGK